MELTKADIGKIAFIKCKSFPFVTWDTLMYWNGKYVTYGKKYGCSIIAVKTKEEAEPIIAKLKQLKYDRKNAILGLEHEYLNKAKNFKI